MSPFARYGRKTIFYICAVLQLILGVAVAFVPEFYSLLVVRFFYGVFGSAGAYITGFVLSKSITLRRCQTDETSIKRH